MGAIGDNGGLDSACVSFIAVDSSVGNMGMVCVPSSCPEAVEGNIVDGSFRHEGVSLFRGKRGSRDDGGRSSKKSLGPGRLPLIDDRAGVSSGVVDTSSGESGPSMSFPRSEKSTISIFSSGLTDKSNSVVSGSELQNGGDRAIDIGGRGGEDGTGTALLLHD